MTIIIAVQSFRQGTGKTTVVANVAACLATQGKVVGVADLNFPAPTLHLPFGVSMHPRTHHLNNFLWGGCHIEEAIVAVPLPSGELGRLFLLPASINPHDMMRMGRSAAHVPLLNTALQEFAEACALDVLLLDLHGGLHDEVLLAMAMADVLWIVLRPDVQDFLGTSISLDLATRLAAENVALIVNEVPPSLDEAQVAQTVRQTYGREVLTVLPHEPEIAALASAGVFCWRWPRHPAAERYQQLTTALLHHG
ncbi:MAG: MinD/ParA family protein [Chloroflexi bacterium]|nr:MinD/ParA family protein [Chloroflexota bacterium]